VFKFFVCVICDREQEFGVQVSGLDCGFRVLGLVFRVSGLGFRV